MLEVRTVDGKIDTAWIAKSSGFPEVDEFALANTLSTGLVIQIGFGDPPFQMKVAVRVPADEVFQAVSSVESGSEENRTIPATVTIPPGSDVENEEDVLVEVQLVGEIIDTAWVTRSSGFPEVDEIAIGHVMTLKQSRAVFSGFGGNESFLMRVFVRQPSAGELE